MWKINHELKMLATGKEVEFWITDEIRPDEEHRNWITGEVEITESTTSQRYFVENLKGVGSGDTVKIYINCMGGSVKEAIGIYNTLRRCGAFIEVRIDGFGASAASIIAMAGDRVIMPRNTAMMLHNAAWAVYGNPQQLRKSAADLEVINMAAIQSYLCKAGSKLPPTELTRMLDSETWLTAEDCVAYGLADEFAESDADIGKMAEQFRAARAASENTPEASLYQKPPKYLIAALAEKPPSAPTPGKDPEPPAPTPAPEQHSFIYALMRGLTRKEKEND